VTRTLARFSFLAGHINCILKPEFRNESSLGTQTEQAVGRIVSGRILADENHRAGHPDRSQKGEIMRRRSFSGGLTMLVALCGYAGAVAADLPEFKCPVSGHAASKEHVAQHNEGKVYFCSDKCAKAFAAKPDEFAAKANLQLVQSGQFKLVKCPLEGYTLNPITAMEVGGVKVLFCCKGCKNEVRLTKSEDERINLVFNDKAFKKGFEKNTNPKQ
jgi:YHS domain-containing protein